MFASGGATVLYGEVGSASSMFIDNANITKGSITNDGVIELGGGTNVIVSSGSTISASGCTFAGGGDVLTTLGGAFYLNGGAQASFHGVAFASNTGSRGGAFYFANDTSASFTSCTFAGNSAGATQGNSNAMYLGNAIIAIKDCTLLDNQNIRLTNASGKVTLNGSNALKGTINDAGSVTISSGAIIDLTGNSNATPINPGGGVIVDGGCTVINSAGASVSIAGGTYTQISKDGTTE